MGLLCNVIQGAHFVEDYWGELDVDVLMQLSKVNNFLFQTVESLLILQVSSD